MKHLELEDSLAHVLSVEDTDETLGSVVDTISLVDEHLEGTILDPLLHILLVLLGVDIPHTLVTDNEAAHSDTLDNDVLEVGDGVGGGVVLGDKAADDDTTEVVHSIESSFEVLATNILVIDVNALWSETSKSIGRFLILVVETLKAESLGDILQLLVGANGADNTQTFVLSELANQLTDSTAGSGDEDSFAFLGLANLIQRGVSGQTRHTKGAKEDTNVLKSERVFELAKTDHLLLADSDILLDCDVTDDQVTFLVVGIVRTNDLSDDSALNGLVEIESRGVRLGPSRAHATAHVRVEARVEGLKDNTVRGGSNVGVIIGRLNGQILSRYRISLGNLLENESLVGHGEGCVLGVVVRGRNGPEYGEMQSSFIV